MNVMPFHRRPAFRIALGIALTLGIYLWLLGKLDLDLLRAIRTILVDLLIAIGALFFTVSLVAQFVLPVRDSTDRRAVVARLLGYVTGERGPIMFLRNGEPIEAHRERQRRGAGVLLIDHASAAVLRTDTRFTKTVGPGVEFTAPGEKLAESLDLRPQIRTIQASTRAQDEESEEKELNALAVTRDGIPISANLSVQFSLDPGRAVAVDPGRCMPPPYNRDAVRRAVYGRVFSEAGEIAWNELPLLL
ncbi:MAG TPA: hypothetical protein VF982_09580, partial [Anaerolineales bacterium]